MNGIKRQKIQKKTKNGWILHKKERAKENKYKLYVYFDVLLKKKNLS